MTICLRAAPAPCATCQLLGYGEFASLAAACPKLTSIHLDQVHACGPIFQPLARLGTVTSITLHRVKAPHGALGLGDSLAQLSSSLVTLVATDEIEAEDIPALYSRRGRARGGEDDRSDADEEQEEEEEEDEEEEDSDEEEGGAVQKQLSRSRLYAEHLLSGLMGCSALRSLTLGLLWVGPGECKFDRLGELTQLTSLSLRQCPPQEVESIGPPPGASKTWTAQSLAFLPRLAHLRRLCLPGAELDAPVLRLVLQLRCLEELEVASLEPKEDLTSSCPPAPWRRLSMDYLTDLQFLMRVPLAAGAAQLQSLKVKVIRFWVTRDCEERERMKADATADCADPAAALRAAAAVLARAWEGNSSLVMYCHGRSPVPTADILAALAPMRTRRHAHAGNRIGLELLGSEWDFDEQHLRLVHDCMPDLHALQLACIEETALPGVLTALGPRGGLLPSLRALIIEYVAGAPNSWGQSANRSGDPLSEQSAAVALAMLQMATWRVDGKSPLLVRMKWDPAPEQRRFWNQGLAQHYRQRVAEGLPCAEVEFTHF